ncbi:GerAB/ArcD/ProY family transporter [Alicyclobacillus sp. ALC3]|uniref:GerAB/ArcD/ProY family transporter n=1 Tax=Alicyclobacillus sp. ALC3 TaxID=2796143 RepID=UPI002378CBEC|nr:GerAB/ArcD/ProY family transporter [Alicyclobacillus sp. ALC3]WDL96060.1 GerAB/ArcD/ProY family transporter [Alicyclobacillus sp. ALC3]
MRQAATQRREYLSWFQTVELGSSSFLPLAFWVFPRIAVEHAGMDAQWSVFLVIVGAIAIALIHGALNERFPAVTGADMHVLTYGKWLSIPVLIAYEAVYVFFVGMSLFYFVASIQPFYAMTPRWVMAGALCLIAIRMSWHGVESLGRVSAIVHPLTWFGVISVFTVIMLQAKWFWIPHTVTSWHDTFRGAYYLLPLGLGFNLFLILSPYYEHKKNRSIWYPMISAVAGMMAVVIAFFAVILNIGWEGAREVTFTIQYALQLIRMQGWIVERLGILIIIFATAYTVLFVSTHLWGISILTCRILNQSTDGYKRFIIPIAIAIFSVTVWFTDTQQAFKILDKWLVPISWILLLIIPLMTYLCAAIRGVRTEQLPVPKPYESRVKTSKR